MLRDLVAILGSRHGIDTSDSASLSLLIRDINQAAFELHKKVDIEEAMDEQVFDLNTETQQIALPSYVYVARGWRYHETEEKIEIGHGRNRYGYNNCGDEVWSFNFREKRKQPTSRELVNQTILAVSVPLAESEEFSVTISGATPNSSRDSETLVFAIEDKIKLTTLNFQDPIDSIVKSSKTKYDVTVKDSDDNILAVIPNYDTKVNYSIYQVWDTDDNGISTNVPTIEVRFKYHFKPCKELTDSFWGTDVYDQVIEVKYEELRTKDIVAAGAFQTKASQLLNDIDADRSSGRRKKITYKKSPFIRPYYEERQIGFNYK